MTDELPLSSEGTVRFSENNFTSADKMRCFNDGPTPGDAGPSLKHRIVSDVMCVLSVVPGFCRRTLFQEPGESHKPRWRTFLRDCRQSLPPSGDLAKPRGAKVAAL